MAVESKQRCQYPMNQRTAQIETIQYIGTGFEVETSIGQSNLSCPQILNFSRSQLLDIISDLGKIAVGFLVGVHRLNEINRTSVVKGRVN